MLNQIQFDGWTVANDMKAPPVGLANGSHVNHTAAYPSASGPLYAIEGDDYYRLWFTMPALDPASLSLSASGSTVTIQGTYIEPKIQKNEKFVLGYPRGGPGWWSLRLPFEVTKGQIEATYTNGMLELKVAKDASMKTAVPIPLKAA
ncbi:MAG: Hsp20 family protein [Pseudomonadota bacterium]